MEKCFCIEDKDQYLEQILVTDHNEVPIFFICKDNDAHYAVLCSDTEKLDYIIIRISDDDLYHLLNGTLPMRDIFTKQDEYWEVRSGDEIESDIVTKKKMTELDHSVLPEAGACYQSF